MRFPLVVQYAFDDRTRGFFVEGGVNFFNFFTGVADYKISMTSPVDLHAGIGFRIPSEGRTSGALRIAADAGRFGSGSVDDKDVDISSDKQALHYSITVGGGFSF